MELNKKQKLTIGSVLLILGVFLTFFLISGFLNKPVYCTERPCEQVTEVMASGGCGYTNPAGMHATLRVVYMNQMKLQHFGAFALNQLEGVLKCLKLMPI